MKTINKLVNLEANIIPLRKCPCLDIAMEEACKNYRLCWHKHKNPEYYLEWSLKEEMYAK